MYKTGLFKEAIIIIITAFIVQRLFLHTVEDVIIGAIIYTLLTIAYRTIKSLRK